MPQTTASIPSTSDTCRLEDHGTIELADQFAAARPALRRMVALRMSAAMTARIDASDVLQEAFLEADRRLPEFISSPGISVMTWLRQVTRQTLASLCRRHFDSECRDVRRETQLLAPLDTESMVAELEESMASPHSVVAGLESREKLLTVIASMDEQDRDVLSMRALEERSFAEIAEELGISRDAAMKRFQRAIIRLGESMTQSNEPT